MSCTPMTNADNETVGWVCGSKSIAHPTDDIQWKWCYKCRYYTEHVWTAFFNVGPWYDPYSRWNCPECDGDHTRMW